MSALPLADGPAMYFGGTIMTFALPFGAFIAAAIALYFLFRPTHSGPRLKYLTTPPVASVAHQGAGPRPGPHRGRRRPSGAARRPHTPETAMVPGRYRRRSHAAPETAAPTATPSDTPDRRRTEGKDGEGVTSSPTALPVDGDWPAAGHDGPPRRLGGTPGRSRPRSSR